MLDNAPVGIFFAFFPLLLSGLAFGSWIATLACLCGSVVAGLLFGPPGFLLFGGCIALPVHNLLCRILLWRGAPKFPTWYPMIKAITELTALIGAALMILALATGSHGGLEPLLPQEIHAGLQNPDPDIAAMAQQMLESWRFALFAMAGWMWVILLYAFAVLANRLLTTKGMALRPSLALEPRGVPEWMLGLVLICGLLATVGQGLDGFTAKAIFPLLLLPYFLCGVARVHAFSHRGVFFNRRLWIICFYIALAFGRWPILLVIAIGLYTQIAEMLDRRKKMG